MAGPGGKEIGRLTVRVLPDTDGFRKKVEQALKGFEDVEIGLELDSKGFREQVTAAVKAAEAGQNVKVGIDFDRSNLENMLDYVNDKLKPVQIPINADRLQSDIDKAVGTSKPVELDVIPVIDDSGIKPKQFDVYVNVNKPDLEREFETLKPPTVDVDLNTSGIGAELDRVEKTLDPLQVDLLPRFDPKDRAWTPRLNPIEIPVQVDSNALSEEARKARASAVAILEKANLLVKLDADDDDLRRKITQAREELERVREFGVDIRMDAEAAPLLKKMKQVEDRLELLDLQKSSPSVDLRKQRAEAELEELNSRLEFVSNKDYSVEVQGDFDKALTNVRNLENQLAKLTSKREKIRIDVDDNSVANAFDVLSGKITNFSKEVEKSGKNGTKFLEPIGDAVTGIGNGIGKAVPKVQSFTDNLASWGQKMQGIQSVTQQAVLLLGTLPAIGFAIAVAGAAATVAFGAIATAIAAINPAIGLIAGSFGVIYLGIDGIKRAFASLTPEVNRLKATASNAFEKGLKPAVENIRSLMGTLEPAVKGIATEFSKMGVSLSEVLKQADKAGFLSDVFENIRSSVERLTTPISSIVDSMLRVMSLESGFKALTGAVDAFSAAFDQSVKKTISDGSLDRAFQGLEQVLRSLSRAFVGLVENGLKAFAGAAPGTSKFIDSLTSFFGRFDFERLGTAAGRVFEGLGSALDSVDDSTIESITQSFEKLGDLFMDPGFQEGLTSIVDALPGVIDFIKELSATFSDVADEVSGIIKFFTDLADGIEALDKKISEFLESSGIADFFEMLGKWMDDHGLDWITDFFQGLSESPIGAGVGTFDGFFEGFPTWDSLLGDDPTIDTNKLKQSIIDAVTSALKEAFANFKPEAGSSFTVTLNSGAFMIALDTLVLTAKAKFELLAETIGGLLILLREVIRTQFEGLATDATLQIDLMRIGVVAAMQAMVEQIGLALINLHFAFTTAFAGLAVLVQTQMLAIQLAMANGLLVMTQAAMIQLESLRLAFETAFLGVALTVQTQMLAVQMAMINGLILMTQNTVVQLEAIRLAFQTAFLAILNTVTIQMFAIQNAFNIAFVAMLATAQFQMESIRLTVETAMLAMVLAVTTGMMQVANSFTIGFTNANTTVTTQMNIMVATVQAAIAAMLVAVTLGFALIPTAIAVGMALAVVAVVAGFANMVSAAISGIASFVSAIVSGLASAYAAWDAWADQTAQQIIAWRDNMVSTAISAMSSFASAIASGFSSAVSAVSAGVSAAISAVGRMASGFAEAGANAVRALASAIASGASAVISAAASIARQAIAAAKSALGIASPSREFLYIGRMTVSGLTDALDRGRKNVSYSASRLATTAITEASKIAEAFEPLTGEIGNDIPSSIRVSRNGELQASIESPDYADVYGAVSDALSQWGIQIDANGIARMVNNANTRRARR